MINYYLVKARREWRDAQRAVEDACQCVLLLQPAAVCLVMGGEGHCATREGETCKKNFLKMCQKKKNFQKKHIAPEGKRAGARAPPSVYLGTSLELEVF